MRLFRQKTTVDNFWEEHTVGGKKLRNVKNAAEDRAYLDWRFEEHPMFLELMDLWGEHSNEVILDYGCGPGNDVVGFLLYTKAKAVIGVDVSSKALAMAAKRLEWHKQQAKLMRVSDAWPRIPLAADSVDYIHCAGCLQHTSNPLRILRDFYRVAKIGATGRVMVYNRDSIWLHLYVAYVEQIVNGKYPGMNAYDAFRLTTDGQECPVARNYTPEEFECLCNNAGLSCSFLGAYLTKTELGLLHYLPEAIACEQLAPTHRHFLRDLTFDDGLPLYQGKYAGVGGVYRLEKE